MDENDSQHEIFNQVTDYYSFSSKPISRIKEKRTQSIEEGVENPETRIAYGNETIPIVDKFAIDCQSEMNIISDENGTSVILNVPEVKRFHGLLKDKSVKVRLITEINSSNVGYCKQVIEQFGIEIKHLSGIKGNLAISDRKEYAATTVLHNSKPLIEVVYSNVKGIVEQNQFVFETLWNKATPAEHRIREIEEGLLPVETKIITTNEEIISQINNLFENTRIGVSICGIIGSLQLLDNLGLQIQSHKNLIKRHKEGKIKKGIRWITHIEDNKEQVALVKKIP